MAFSFKEFITAAERAEVAEIILKNKLYVYDLPQKDENYEWYSLLHCAITNIWPYGITVDTPVIENYKYAIICCYDDVPIASCIISDYTPFELCDNRVQVYVNTQFRKKGICKQLLSMIISRYPNAINYNFDYTDVKSVLQLQTVYVTP